MTKTTLTPTRFENGVYEAHITGPVTPQIEVIYLGEAVAGTEVTPDENGWRLSIPIPIGAVSEGVHTFVIGDPATGETLESFTVIAGSPAADILLSEVDLLRAELDMLKRAFRRLHHSD